jgi:hypothetical protein
VGIGFKWLENAQLFAETQGRAICAVQNTGDKRVDKRGNKKKPGKPGFR